MEEEKMEAFTDDRTANRQKAAYELEAPNRLDSGGSLSFENGRFSNDEANGVERPGAFDTPTL